MKMNIILLTATKCEPKGKNAYTRLDYINLDNKNQSSKVKGNIVQVLFAKAEAFDNIPSDVVGDKCTAVIELNNNLKANVKALETSKHGTISLV